MTGIKSLFVYVFLIFSVVSCQNKYEYWPVSKFKLNSNALPDSAEIKLLYTSRGPDNNEELKYYIHVVAISQKTGDTVNILTTEQNDFTIDDKEKIFNYLSHEGFTYKLIRPNFESKLKMIDKVARDPEFDNIADNNYPTVIGMIGVLMPAGTN